MPRPKPNDASPVFMVVGHSISSATKKKLVELLGFPSIDLLEESVRMQFPGYRASSRTPGAPVLLAVDPKTRGKTIDVGAFINDVEIALGLYIEAKQHIDNVPRPAHYVAAFNPIERDATKLLKRTMRLGGYFREQFALRKADLHAIECALISLREVSRHVVEEYEVRSSKGANKNNALCETIRRLRQIFRKAYKGNRTERKRRGAFIFRAEAERHELEFVETALRDARIIPKSFRQLARLFRDSRCAVSTERIQFLERIAQKVSKNRRQ